MGGAVMETTFDCWWDSSSLSMSMHTFHQILSTNAINLILDNNLWINKTFATDATPKRCLQEEPFVCVYIWPFILYFISIG